MISIEQIRAARGLINWSQTDLAKASGISLNALSNLEKGQAVPRSDTLQAVQKSLEGAGVEFLPGKGVRLRSELFAFEKFEGENIINHHLKDILDVLGDAADKEVLYWVDNKKYEAAFPGSIKLYRDYYRRYVSEGIKIRCLLGAGDHGFAAPENIYRWTPQETMSEIPYGVYGNTVAIILWGPPPRLVLLRNQAIADLFRKQFNAFWQHAVPVPEKVFLTHLLRE
jgi:transcriptional regulator with XRE-family HTH domain